jgi:CTP:molybdopterin cytidylyltransferase MocA
VAVSGLLLAAGGGRRYGGPKALVVENGVAWVDQAIETLVAGGCATVTVVLGARAAEVRERVALRHVRAVDNSDWADGLATSLRAGLAALATDPLPVAALVILVDTPGLTPAAVRRIAAHAAADALVVATYAGRPGHPVLLGRDHWPGVAATARGDHGARGYLRRHAANVRHVPCDDIADGRDRDRPGP